MKRRLNFYNKKTIGYSIGAANETLDVLREIVKDKIHSLRATQMWPQKEQVLTSLNYFVWDYLKIVACIIDKQQILLDLKCNLRREIDHINPGIFPREAED